MSVMAIGIMVNYLLLMLVAVLGPCSGNGDPQGPCFGNGFRNGWADQHSVVIWTRLTRRPDMNLPGTKFIPLSDRMHDSLRVLGDKDAIHAAQIPEKEELEDMEGACPGQGGQVQLRYYPEGKEDQIILTEWVEVEENRNFTRQWKLEDLSPDTRYRVEIFARSDTDSPVSDTVVGSFLTPPVREQSRDIAFCIVTCHDYIRRDDSTGGHKIYPSMSENQPDFYVHTGDVEYYDKPDPYAMTLDLMRFKWDRLFALPFQREFYTRTTCYFMKDDHDVLCDDAYPGMNYGTVDFERGLDIFDHEQFPSNDLPYKTIRWGRDLQIWLMEGRNFRSPNTDADGPVKTIWGSVQKEWLFRTVAESDATFKLIITPTPILGPDRKAKNDNYSNGGFRHEGDEIRAFINGQKNLYICCGDRHWQYVTHPEGSNLWEFSCGAGSDVHAGGWSQEDRRPGHRFLRVKGGYLLGRVYEEGGTMWLRFSHCDVDGKVVHEELLPAAD